MASRDPKHLCPEMRAKLVEFLARAREHGVDPLIYCTFRSPEEQRELYGYGRNGDKRQKVTWTLKSKHNLVDSKGNPASEAWDCVPVVKGKLRWDDDRGYRILAEIAVQLGLKWGGEFGDSPHFELVR